MQEPPLYPEASLETWKAELPQLESTLVEDVNHFTILLSTSGAEQVAQTVRRMTLPEQGQLPVVAEPQPYGMGQPLA